MTLDLGVPGVSSLSFLFGARLYLEPGDVLVLSWIHSSLYGLPFRLRPRHRGRSGGGRGRGGGGLARSCQLFLQHVDLAVELHVLPGQMFHPTMLHLAFVPMALVCRFDLNGLKKQTNRHDQTKEFLQHAICCSSKKLDGPNRWSLFHRLALPYQGWIGHHPPSLGLSSDR